eukprot:492906-Rhodomonas_salina.3
MACVESERENGDVGAAWGSGGDARPAGARRERPANARQRPRGQPPPRAAHEHRLPPPGPGPPPRLVVAVAVAVAVAVSLWVRCCFCVAAVFVVLGVRAWWLTECCAVALQSELRIHTRA